MGTATGTNVQDPVRRLRELDHRRHDGIDVSLLWEATTNAVFVSVIDERGGASFRIQPPASRALDAFRHPFVYAPSSERRADSGRHRPENRHGLTSERRGSTS